MKNIILLSILSGLAFVHYARGQENVVFEFRVGHEKTLRRIVIEPDASAAPQTVDNFERLVRRGFYRGLKIHRVIPHTLVQMGDPLSRRRDLSRLGTGGPGYTLPPEIHLRNTTGAVAMARLPNDINPGRRSSGSQFYICLKPMPELDGQYTVFGHVVEGMDALDSISTQSADSNNNPVPPILIKAAYPESRPPSQLKLWPWG